MFRLKATDGSSGRLASAGPRCALDLVSAPDVRVSALVSVHSSESGAQLAHCLESLRGLVDEALVVIHPHVELSAVPAWCATWRPGAPAGESHTREEGTARLTGDWVLHLRAHEVLEGDLGALRRRLAASASDVIDLPVERAPGFERLLVRREAVRWVGDAGCTATSRLGRPLVRQDFTPPVSVSSATVVGLSRVDGNGSHPSPPSFGEGGGKGHAGEVTLLEGVRRAAERGQVDVARRLAHQVIRETSDPESVLEAVWLIDSAVAGRPARAPLDPSRDSVDGAAVSVARDALGGGDADLAVKALRPVLTHGVNTRVQSAASHISAERAATMELLAQALRALGRPYESSLVLLRAMSIPDWQLDLEGVLDTFEALGSDFVDVSDLVHPESLAAFTRQAIERPTPAGSRWLLRLTSRRADDVGVLRGGARASAALGVKFALPWSVLVRHRGDSEACPLRYLASGGTSDAEQRYMAGRLLLHCFGESGPVVPFDEPVAFEVARKARLDQELELVLEAWAVRA